MARVRLPSRPRRGPTSSSSPPRPPIVGRYGDTIGTLQVVDTSQSPAVVKFTEIGDQGNVWKSTTVDVVMDVDAGRGDEDGVRDRPAMVLFLALAFGIRGRGQPWP